MLYYYMMTRMGSTVYVQCIMDNCLRQEYTREGQGVKNKVSKDKRLLQSCRIKPQISPGGTWHSDVRDFYRSKTFQLTFQRQSKSYILTIATRNF